MRFRDLNKQYTVLRTDIDDAIQSVINSGTFILGEPVSRLEQELAQYVGVSHCISCANGTDALTLVLRAWGIGKGDAVFVPDFTYIATASAAAIIGATPVFVDIDNQTMNMSPQALEDAIRQTARSGRMTPKAIIPVDLFGLPADYDAIGKIADQYGLLLLEDGAQSFGAEIHNRRACSFGDAAITSFFPVKPLGCYGDGGAIFTNDAALNDQLRILRRNGASPEDKYDNKVIGMNSRLDTLQAAILLVKLEALTGYERKAIDRIAKHYMAQLPAKLVLPAVPVGYFSAWAQFTIRLSDQNRRDGLKKHLAERGIPSIVYYPRALHTQTCFRQLEFRLPGNYPIAEQTCMRVLSLPMHPYLTMDEIDLVCGEIVDYLRNDK